jgi:DNA-binding FadR family transcriptional regulator
MLRAVSSAKTERVAGVLQVTKVAKRRSASSQIADQIVSAVREHRLAVGDRLPSERELAELFGVSRPTVREAVAALELAGVVEPQTGRGTVVVATPSGVAMWGVDVLPPQVLEARLAIEPQLARLAAEKRYPDDLARLEAALADLETEFAATGGFVSDLPIHRAIARTARNPILERALEDALVHTQTELWTELRKRAFSTRSAFSGHLREARQVVGHIRGGRSRQAGSVWEKHLLRFRDEMLRGADQGPLA